MNIISFHKVYILGQNLVRENGLVDYVRIFEKTSKYDEKLNNLLQIMN